MLDAIVKILPLLLVFAAGNGLKQAKLLKSEDGSSLLKLVFFAGLPALVFESLLTADLDSSLIWLSLLAPSVVVITLGAGALLRQTMLARLPQKTFGAMIVGAVIMNTGFLLPFVQNLYGAEGLARLAIIDTFNGIVTFSLVYALAVKYGNDRPEKTFIVKKLLIAPPLWALFLALSLRASGTTPPAVLMDAVALIAPLVAPSVLLALGLKFTVRLKQPKLLLYPLLLRFGLGALIGVSFVKITGLAGLDAQIAIFASMAPIGFNSITFSELENLDVDFAASQVSAGLIVALLTAPIVVHMLSYL